MTIVPERADLRVEVKLSPADIDQVRLRANCAAALFVVHRNTTPELQGTVVHVSPSVTRDPATGLMHLYRRDRLRRRHSKLGERKLLPACPSKCSFRSTSARRCPISQSRSATRFSGHSGNDRAESRLRLQSGHQPAWLRAIAVSSAHTQSRPPLRHEQRGGLEHGGVRAERRQRFRRVLDQGGEALLRFGDAEHGDDRRLAGGGVLAGLLADGGGVALDVEDVVGDLERLADRGAVALERGEALAVGFAQNRAGDGSRT